VLASDELHFTIGADKQSVFALLSAALCHAAWAASSGTRGHCDAPLHIMCMIYIVHSIYATSMYYDHHICPFIQHGTVATMIMMIAMMVQQHHYYIIISPQLLYHFLEYAYAAKSINSLQQTQTPTIPVHDANRRRMWNSPLRSGQFRGC
jgi:hypothetical protein